MELLYSNRFSYSPSISFSIKHRSQFLPISFHILPHDKHSSQSELFLTETSIKFPSSSIEHTTRCGVFCGVFCFDGFGLPNPLNIFRSLIAFNLRPPAKPEQRFCLCLCLTCFCPLWVNQVVRVSLCHESLQNPPQSNRASVLKLSS